MKALLLLAATGVGTLAAMPHLPDLTTVKNEIETALGSVTTQPPQPTQPGQIAQTNPPQDGTTPGETPYVAQASPNDVLQTYGQPSRVERSVYGETWYYPVYIIYFHNGYMHRVHRETSSTASTQNFVPNTALGRSNVVASALAPQTASQSWRFTSNNSLGSVQLGGSGVARANHFVTHQTGEEPSTIGGTSSSYHSGASYHPAGGVSTAGTYSRPVSTSTAPVSHPAAVVVHHSVSVTTAPVNRIGN